jgi:hypothetical protein
MHFAYATMTGCARLCIRSIYRGLDDVSTWTCWTCWTCWTRWTRWTLTTSGTIGAIGAIGSVIAGTSSNAERKTQQTGGKD